MLKGIPDILSPELLKLLAEMGHGDELVIGDANFPAASTGKRCVRADGHKAVPLLNAILQLLPLDTFVEHPVTLMAPDPSILPGDPPIWKGFGETIGHHQQDVSMEAIDRFAFYERSKNAYGVVSTGEREFYACLILKKGTV